MFDILNFNEDRINKEKYEKIKTKMRENLEIDSKNFKKYLNQQKQMLKNILKNTIIKKEGANSPYAKKLEEKIEHLEKKEKDRENYFETKRLMIETYSYEDFKIEYLNKLYKPFKDSYDWVNNKAPAIVEKELLSYYNDFEQYDLNKLKNNIEPVYNTFLKRLIYEEKNQEMKDIFKLKKDFLDYAMKEYKSIKKSKDEVSTYEENLTKEYEKIKSDNDNIETKEALINNEEKSPKEFAKSLGINYDEYQKETEKNINNITPIEIRLKKARRAYEFIDSYVKETIDLYINLYKEKNEEKENLDYVKALKAYAEKARDELNKEIEKLEEDEKTINNFEKDFKTEDVVSTVIESENMLDDLNKIFSTDKTTVVWEMNQIRELQDYAQKRYDKIKDLEKEAKEIETIKNLKSYINKRTIIENREELINEFKAKQENIIKKNNLRGIFKNPNELNELNSKIRILKDGVKFLKKEMKNKISEEGKAYTNEEAYIKDKAYINDLKKQLELLDEEIKNQKEIHRLNNKIQILRDSVELLREDMKNKSLGKKKGELYIKDLEEQIEKLDEKRKKFKLEKIPFKNKNVIDLFKSVEKYIEPRFEYIPKKERTAELKKLKEEIKIHKYNIKKLLNVLERKAGIAPQKPKNEIIEHEAEDGIMKSFEQKKNEEEQFKDILKLINFQENVKKEIGELKKDLKEVVKNIYSTSDEKMIMKYMPEIEKLKNKIEFNEKIHSEIRKDINYLLNKVTFYVNDFPEDLTSVLPE